MPGRASCRCAVRGTRHEDMTTWSCVPQLVLMLLHPTAQPGSAEEHSRLAGKEMSFANATVEKVSHHSHKESESVVSSCAGKKGFF